MENKTINRDHQTTNKLFDDRTLQKDYVTLIPLLKQGMKVLDVGCGTGAISRGIAEIVGPEGTVTGIDQTEKFIISGNEHYVNTTNNLTLLHSDLFNYNPVETFDLIIAARTLQWLSNPVEALKKMKFMLRPGGTLSILDYNHESLEWEPLPPPRMLQFYQAFLQWRADAGMNNQIAEALPGYFEIAGFEQIEIDNADEVYDKGDLNFNERIGIWSKVVLLSQISTEGYLSEEKRQLAIQDYDDWVGTAARKMVVKLKEVKGKGFHQDHVL